MMMNNQGKRKEQIEQSYKLAFWSFGGIAMVLFISFMDLSCEFSNEVVEGIKNDPRPANHLSNYMVPDKNDNDWTGTTQGVYDTMTEAELMLSKEPDCIYYDTLEWQREEDSINAYMKHWYEVLDTNSDGDIDDSTIEWLEE
tara:strand:+ start:1727 stop:2152 length:426 start_codon:yes stop_codon:yes gene_type:complete